MNPIINSLRFQDHVEEVIPGMTQLLSKHLGRFSRGGVYRLLIDYEGILFIW
jgi:hypothetical protein